MPTLGSTSENAIAFDKKRTTYAKFDSKYPEYIIIWLILIIVKYMLNFIIENTGVNWQFISILNSDLLDIIKIYLILEMDNNYTILFSLNINQLKNLISAFLKMEEL